jgi:hypothetical protein
MKTVLTTSLGAGLLLAAAVAPPAEARLAAKECGGLPALTLLEGGGYAVNAYRLDCGKGAARSALVIPDGAAATGDGLTCELGGESFAIVGNAVAASAIRAGRGNTVRCRENQAVEQASRHRGRPRPKRFITLRPSDQTPLPGGTTCETSNETLSGAFMLDGTEVEVTVEAILTDCGASGSALIVPRGATTTVAPIIKRVHLSCPVDRFRIPNRAEGRSHRQVVVAGDQIADCKARRRRETASFDLTLPLPCGDRESKCVFVSSTRHQGNSFGGLAVADSECNALATDAGLPGSYKAWMSDSTASPSSRFNKATVPYRLVDGTQIAADWNDLVTCNADESRCLDNPISLTESGTDTSGFPTNARRIWTGTQTNGLNGLVTDYSCGDWIDSGLGVFGFSGSKSWSWTGGTSDGFSSSWHCAAKYAFMCFQQ